jgi:hypothetical protein
MDHDRVLESLAAKLRSVADDVSVRGTGRARFLYVTGRGRAVEASVDEDGAIWVEYWSELSEDAQVVKDGTFRTVEEAEVSILGWLAGEM